MSSISSVYSTAAYGLNSATARLNSTAQNIANYGSGAPGSDDMVGNVVNLDLEKASFQASALVLKTADQTLGALLDVFDTSPKG